MMSMWITAGYCGKKAEFFLDTAGLPGYIEIRIREKHTDSFRPARGTDVIVIDVIGADIGSKKE